jgi:outer membrane protein OmpA-like peptidoglycan-associated protein
VKLPEFWTLEFDVHTAEPASGALTIRGIVEGNVSAWSAELLQYGSTTVMFQSGPVNATTQYEGGASMAGRHHVMLLGRGTGLKIYVDTQRVINVPDATGSGVATEVQIELMSMASQPMITNVRFAEGNKPVKDPFADGKFVTYGIYFDSGSDVEKAESAPVLRQMAAYLEANATVNVEIVGHTDNEGTAAGNLDLSKRRAAAVAQVLTEQFKIAAERFKTDGMGDTKPVASNDNAEGRATNRRVEFTKLLEKI